MSVEREVAILPVRPGTLTAKDRTELRKAGVIVVEHERPEELRLLRPGVEMDAGTMLGCALKALAHGGPLDYVQGNRELFVKLLAEAFAP